MKFDKKTLAMLKNFATINQSIIFPADSNILRTCSIQKTIVASTEINEEFPMRVGIYDLNQFLSTMSLFEDPELEFEDSHILIKSGRKRSKYFYTDEKMIVAPPDKDLNLPDVQTTFVLPAEIKQNCIKAASVLQVENIVISANEDEVKLIARDKKNNTSNTFEEVLENFCHRGEPKEYTFRVENLKMVDLDYDVEMSTKGISKFVGADGKVKYWVATEKE